MEYGRNDTAFMVWHRDHFTCITPVPVFQAMHNGRDYFDIVPADWV